MNFTFRDIVWVGIITIIIVLLSKCHRDKTNELSKDVTALVNDRKKTDAIHNYETLQLQNKLKSVTDLAHLAQTEQHTAEDKLSRSIATASRLAAELRRIKGWPTDTTAILVAQEYVDYCDSLARTTDSITVDYITFKRKNTFLLAGKDTVLRLQKQLYDNERKASEQCRRDFNALQQYYTLAEQRSKPTNQVYIGAELIGSRQLLVQNVGAVLSLKTKSNKLWQLSGGVQNGGGWYGRINGNILIRLRK
jgi:hypothetical protein